MNKNSFIIVLIGILIFSVTINFLAFQEIERTHNEIQRLNEPKEDNEIHFIWNDDEESIPPDGSLIKIEFTDENNVFIGPTE